MIHGCSPAVLSVRMRVAAFASGITRIIPTAEIECPAPIGSGHIANRPHISNSGGTCQDFVWIAAGKSFWKYTRQVVA